MDATVEKMTEPWNPAELPAGRNGLLARAADYLFGYDFFISYSHRDGLQFPRALKTALEQAGLRVFLDQTDFVPAMDLRVETRRQVRKSQKLVVVAGEGALESEWVYREVQVALAAGKVPVILNLDEAVQKAASDSKLAALARHSEWLRVEERLGDHQAGPSARAVAELVRCLTHARQNTKRARAILGAAALLALAAVIASWQAAEAIRQKTVAERNFESARDLADRVVVNIVRGLKEVEGVHTASLQKILTDTDRTFVQLSEQHPENTAIRRSRIGMYNEFVEVYLARGDTAQAMGAAENSVRFARTGAQEPHGEAADRRILGRSLLKLGDAHAEVNDIAKADAAYAEALGIRQQLVSGAPGDAELRRDLSLVLVRQADLAEKRKDWPEATRLLKESAAHRRELVRQKPGWRRDLALGLLRLGDIQLEQKLVGDARQAFSEALEVFTVLLQSTPGNTRAARDHAIGLQRIGNLEMEVRNWDAARVAYVRSRTAFAEVAAKDRDNLEWRRDVAVADGKLAAAFAAAGEVSAAAALLEKVILERRALVAASPAAAHLRADLDEAMADLAVLLKRK